MKLDDFILLRSDRRNVISGFKVSFVGNLFSRYKGILVLMILKKRRIATRGKRYQICSYSKRSDVRMFW